MTTSYERKLAKARERRSKGIDKGSTGQGHLPYWHGSRPHVALSYMKVFREPVSYTELSQFSPIFPNTHGSRSSFLNDMKRAESLGHVVTQRTKTGNYWTITPEGEKMLRVIAFHWRQVHPLDDSDAD